MKLEQRKALDALLKVVAHAFQTRGEVSVFAEVVGTLDVIRLPNFGVCVRPSPSDREGFEEAFPIDADLASDMRWTFFGIDDAVITSDSVQGPSEEVFRLWR